MPRIATCFCYSFVKPKEPADLVMFCESRSAVAKEDAMLYLKRSMEYAKLYHVYLLPGPFILQDYLCLCLISPEGKPIALQKAIYVNVLHHAGLHTADEIEVFSTPLGRISLLPDVDIFHPEVARSAAMQGAEVLLTAQYYDLYDLNPLRTMSGAWEMAQENQISVIAVSNQNCCVCAPAAATNDNSGFVLQPQTTFPVLATLYPHKSQKVRDSADLLSQLNEGFCTRYAAQLGF